MSNYLSASRLPGRAGAGECIAFGSEPLETLPVEQAARRTWTPGGPSVEELEGLIRVYRAIISLGSKQ